jgi:alkylation response protein AidB-like acyl-CoA dehydrogenase
VRDRQAEGDRYLLRLLGSADTALENARSYVREQEQKGGPTLALRG